jgi:hypothetical protein
MGVPNSPSTVASGRITTQAVAHTEPMTDTNAQGEVRTMSASAHPTRARARLLAVTLVALAALTLTACEDGEGLRDEGPSSPTSPTATAAPTTPPK